MNFDKFDKALLASLQQDSTRPLAEVADAIGLGATACWRRIQKLQDAGVVRAQVALLDRAALNVAVTVFVSIRTNQHNSAWLTQFHEAVRAIPQVVEIYRMAGDTDYLLKVVVPDIAAYDGVYKQLIRISGLTDVSSSFAMEQIKYTTALPLDYR